MVNPPIEQSLAAGNGQGSAGVSANAEKAVPGRLEEMAHNLATRHVVAPQPPSHVPFLAQLPRLKRDLKNVRQRLVDPSLHNTAFVSASEWLLDNYYLVVESLQQIEEDLPEGYYRQLPKLVATSPGGDAITSAPHPSDAVRLGQPRVYAAISRFWASEKFQLDLGRLNRFVSAYQQVRVFTMGEVWAIPTMLRLALLRTLTDAATRISRPDEVSANGASSSATRNNGSLQNDNDVVANCILSLRRINSQDWSAFFEEVSLVHRVLVGDPAAFYSKMDFDSRNRYRLVVENLARATDREETSVAERAIQLANKGTLPRQNHVGYYLIDQGREQLEHAVGYKPRGIQWLRQAMVRTPTPIYLGTVGILTVAVVVLAALYAYTAGGGLLWQIASAMLVLVPALTLAVSLVNGAVTRILPPRILPKLDFADGIPTEHRTFVVVPCLIASNADISSLTTQLEMHRLRNSDPNLSFALLSDFSDADEPTMPEDAGLIQVAQAKIEELNSRYSARPFYLFHRRRQWNPAQGVWMGWERKRGKLQEFNHLLRGDANTSYVTQIGDLDALSQFRFVITLDADTILPRGEANRLVGTLAHPLNQAEFDLETGRITSGYTVVQPRTAIKPTSANRSLFTRVFTGDRGIDLYSRAVSDVYQDLFGAGIFVGKGIYDVDAFERSLANRVPENAILSHDLFEGVHGRVGLATDILLYEDYPAHHVVNMSRSSRWVRGDWQLLPWLLPRVPAANGRIPNDLSVIDRWKIADNLRRSLLSTALMALLTAAWTVLPGSAWVWTLFAVLVPAIPSVINGLIAALHTDQQGVRRVPWRQVRDDAMRWLLYIAFLPSDSQLMIDAIATTIWRLATRKNLLQWTTAARTARIFGDEATAATSLAKMARSMLLVVGLAILITLLRPSALVVAAPFFLLWLSAWQIANWISRPDAVQPIALDAEEQQTLRLLARRTWLFYEHFVGPDGNWLPPDHFQEAPLGVLAQRTSPTNIGLYLLTVLAAHDLGYVGMTNTAVRLFATFSTLEAMPRYRGHFYNWVDIKTLETLPPAYVSTVDSGNLAGSLIALKQGLVALPQQTVWRWESWLGLVDLLLLLEEALPVSFNPPEELEQGEASGAGSTLPLREGLALTRRRIMTMGEDRAQWQPLLAHLVGEGYASFSRQIVALLKANEGAISSEVVQNCQIFTDRIQVHLSDMRHEVDSLLPWLSALASPPALVMHPNAHPAIAQTWTELLETFPPAPRLDEIGPICLEGAKVADHLATAIAGFASDDPDASASREWARNLVEQLENARHAADALTDSCNTLADAAERVTHGMEFGFLFDAQRQLFHVGYNVDSGTLDSNYYDLLASEARIASLVAIAKYDVPIRHWVHLGRPLTRLHNGDLALFSWSGTMFEYLMPPLLMRSYPDTLIDASSSAAVEQQMRYAHEKHVPWGISESGFHTFDAAMNYQYHAFGTPGLGLKRGLTDDLVISPYASLLALSVRTSAVMTNIETLRALQMVGRYGFYEAIDFTPARLSAGQEHAIVRSYMTHHQGMIMLALVNRMQDQVMVRRFHAEPLIRSVEMLLQEQSPVEAAREFPNEKEPFLVQPARNAIVATSWQVPIDTPFPLVHYLSNGRYGVLISNAGGGYSTWNENALTRWRADTTLDDWGCWLYVQDLERDLLWSATRQPLAGASDHEEVQYSPHMVTFRRREQEITSLMEVGVAHDEDVEVRRITLTNESDQPRRLRLTTYGEVVMMPDASDRRHPAFGKLFVESEYHSDLNALLFARRPRSAREETPYLIHMLVTPGDPATDSWGERSHQSNRALFLGRGGTVRTPAALRAGAITADESMVTGATLDPVMSLGQEIFLPARATVQLAAVTLAAPTRRFALDLVHRYRNWNTLDRVFSRTRPEVERDMRQAEMTSIALEQTQRLLSLLLYPHAARRGDPARLAENHKGQSALWQLGISGDYPILLLRLKGGQESQTQPELLQELLRAHGWWRRQGLDTNLVILNSQSSDYGQPMQEFILRTIKRTGGDAWLNQRRGIFVLRDDQMSSGDRGLLLAVARVMLDSERGNLAAQLDGLLRQPPLLPRFEPILQGAHEQDVQQLPMLLPTLLPPTPLQFDNGLGGFAEDGEYVIHLAPGQTTPAPWINVIANAEFGTLVSEGGGGYTWAINSGENRLTSWRNDPVGDAPAEALYLRDEETAEVWSPTPQPAPADAPYLVRHGAGYTRFEHLSHNLQQEVCIFVAPDAPVKIMQMKLRNTSTRQRRITVTYYAEWVLGVDRSDTQPYLVSEYAEESHALLARNGYSTEFAGRVVFLAASKQPHGLTADRADFLGRLGTLQRPAALERIGLNNRVDAGVDPCAVLQLHIDLAPGASEQVHFLLGQGADRDAAQALIRRFQDPDALQEALDDSLSQWEQILGTVTVETPDPAMNLMLNRWLLYQTLGCRMWGRSGLYQSSGAYGFRDQLQDAMALVHARPGLAREQILRAAAHQFEEGDVLHWWHPPGDAGVRTRISDDLLWLPYVTAHYVTSTGDTAILNEAIPFLQGTPLAVGEEERYARWEAGVDTFTLYEHCERALRKGATAGAHGIPLMGGGDWNDGMNRVGIEGKGESIWLGWFLHAALVDFAALCRHRGDLERATAYRKQAETLATALEADGWDGEWYRRAWYDDGTPLGSAQNSECQIDSIAQSWSVLSGAADLTRANQAMQSVMDRLVKPDEGLMLLFAPPFDKTSHDPGYIKGYLPGVRENGGQYTHAALWSIWAMARLGKGDQATALFQVLNPIQRADTSEKVSRYMVEPYVISADVYGVAPHIGRGGWTWYTGSAGWMYRLGIEAILGLRRRGEDLYLDPCISREWRGYSMRYHYGKTTYEINVENPDQVSRGVRQVTLDGVEMTGGVIPLADDEQVHLVKVVLGEVRPPLRVLLADHQPRAKQSLRALLTALPWSASNPSSFPIEIVGDDDHNLHTIERVQKHSPDAVLIDLSFPDDASLGTDHLSHPPDTSSGLEAIRAIKGRWPKVRVIVFTMYANDRAAAMRAGADAFLLKGCPTDDLLAAMRPMAYERAN